MGQERQVGRPARHLTGPLCHRSRSRLGGQQHQRPSTPCSRKRPTQAGDPTAPRGTPHQGCSPCQDRSSTPTILPPYRTHGHPRAQGCPGMLTRTGRSRVRREWLRSDKAARLDAASAAVTAAEVRRTACYRGLGQARCLCRKSNVPFPLMVCGPTNHSISHRSPRPSFAWYRCRTLANS